MKCEICNGEMEHILLPNNDIGLRCMNCDLHNKTTEIYQASVVRERSRQMVWRGAKIFAKNKKV